MRLRWMWLIGLSSALALSACGDSKDDPSVDTGDNDTDVDPDTSEPDLGDLALAEVCAHNNQCSSGLCVSLGQGVNDSICSQRCNRETDCGEAGVWDCTEVDTSLPDTISVCVPKGLCLDMDGDQYGVGPGCLGPDCDDDDPNVYFGAPELCDGKDNDCNGIIDDHTVIDGVECNTGLLGLCAIGSFECVDGAAVCNTLVEPNTRPEICNGVDDDCDGLVDERPQDDENGMYVTGTGLPCSSGSAACENGITVCEAQRGIYCRIESDLVDDSCDGIDNDCNGTIDDAVAGLNEPCLAGAGQCGNTGITVCDPSDAYATPICDAEPDLSLATPEVCDNIDNDCDGVVDNGFIDANGIYFMPEHCGACGNNCGTNWDPTPDSFNVTPTCNIVNNSATCGYTCKNGYIDADGRSSNGCELLPNPRAIYVAPANKGGSNDGFCGDWNSPCKDIFRGIEIAETLTSAGSPRDVIIVAEGIYREGVEVSNGISIQGGHNALNWQRNVDEYRSIIIGSVNPTGDRIAMLADGITTPTEISGFTIIGEDGQAGANSIALMVRNSTSNLVIRDNILRAGIGGQGSSGVKGQDGASGSLGIQGVAGIPFNSSTCTAANHRAGGAAGNTICSNPSGGGTTNVSGGVGATAACPSYGGANPQPEAGKGASGGDAGFSASGRGLYQSACYPHPDHMEESFPRDGAIGGTGADGQGGDGATNPDGSVDGSGMWRAHAGQDGLHGAHGSGGGGGGASHGTLDCTGIDGDDRVFENCNTIRMIGSAGGGGGGGGCAASAATGGSGGGGSIALYVLANGGSQLPVVEDNTLERSNGGQGGDGGIAGRGGDGGIGGVGGPAAPAQDYCPQAGRRGGNGGRGGHGGGGGGGAGGISYDIAIFGTNANTTAIQNANTFTVSDSVQTGGNGGPGGGSMGEPGDAGVGGSYGNIFNP